VCVCVCVCAVCVCRAISYRVLRYLILY